MTKLEQIEKSVAALSPEELKAFAAWWRAPSGAVAKRRRREDKNYPSHSIGTCPLSASTLFSQAVTAG